MTRHRNHLRPLFGSDEPVSLIPPPHSVPGSQPSAVNEIKQLRELIEREIHEFEVELGAPAHLTSTSSSEGAKFLLGPAALNPAFSELAIPPSREPCVWIERTRKLLVADAPDIEGVTESLSLLRTLTSSNVTRVAASSCESIDECAARFRQEIAWTYPAFQLRGIDWDEHCRQHEPRLLAADDPFDAMQRWVATLGDMHTWVRSDPPHGLLTYTVHVDPDKATFVHVPAGTSAAEAGVQPGDQLINVDPLAALERTGGPAQMKPYLAGRRLISGPAGIARTFTARSQEGVERSFSDTPSLSPFGAPVDLSKRSRDTGYIRVRGFPPGFNQRIDAAFQEIRECSRLIIDLRGNAGGMLTEALNFRDRFIDRPMTMGTIQYSSPGGELSPSFPIDAEPTSTYARWPKPVRFLTDQMTASASEDALLGLQGLPHIQLVGAPTAGGSGRPRSIRLLPGMRLSVSTALTFDRSGRCIEGNGLQTDVAAPVMLDGDENEAIEVADRSW
jgi:carboxyl-terminal processing protease